MDVLIACVAVCGSASDWTHQKLSFGLLVMVSQSRSCCLGFEISFTYSQGNKLWWHTTEFPLLYFVVQTKRPIRERDRRYRRSHFKNALAKHAGQNSWCICGAGLRVHTAQIWPVHNILKKGKQYGEYHHLLQCFVLWVVSTNINLSSAFVPLFLSHTSTLI